MAIPKFIIGGTDYARFISDLKPVRNDLDADGSGRDISDGYFYRERIALKQVWSVSFIPLSRIEMMSVAAAFKPQYLTITMLDPETGADRQAQYYASSMDYGSQRYIPGDDDVEYIGATITVRER